jgi:hypothetical protein
MKVILATELIVIMRVASYVSAIPISPPFSERLSTAVRSSDQDKREAQRKGDPPATCCVGIAEHCISSEILGVYRSMSGKSKWKFPQFDSTVVRAGCQELAIWRVGDGRCVPAFDPVRPRLRMGPNEVVGPMCCDEQQLAVRRKFDLINVVKTVR